MIMAGQLIRKGDRKWLVRVFLGRDGQTGQKRYFSKQITGTKKDAQNYLNKVLHSIDDGVFVAPSKDTVGEYLDEWLKNSARQKWSDRTYRDYTNQIDRHVRSSLGLRKLSALQPLDIQELYTTMAVKGLSPRSIQIIHNILNSALKQAVKWRLLSRNPAQYVDRPKQVRREMMAFSPEEASRFLEAARHDTYYTFFSLALDTGARPSELLALQWKDIDLEQATVTIQRTLDYPEYGGVFQFIEPKTSRSRRQIRISSTNILNLREHRRIQSELRLKAGPNWHNFDLVFSTSEGKPIQRRNILRRHFKPILKKAGLSTTLNLYSLRHSCATLLLTAGVNPKIVSERLGHASIVLTLDTYSHVLPSMQQAAADKLENLLFAKG
jgi:integrase